MEIKTYAKEAFRTTAHLDSLQLDSYHMLMGIATETGELFDAYKKELAYNATLDLVNVSEEIGDLMWYIINFCTFNNLDLENILEKNIAKLKERYPEKFTKKNALNRDLVKERSVLE